MKKIVIMQPYYLAWYGFFEQIKLADVYVFLDDVQFVKRSLMSRVDIKTRNGPKWMTIPLKKVHQKDILRDIICNEEENWRDQHLRQLNEAYRKAPYFYEMLEIVKSIYSTSNHYLTDVTIKAIKIISEYYDLSRFTTYYSSSELNIKTKGSLQLLDICKLFDAETYITGMGALKYFDYGLFERNGVNVEFMDYAKTEYPQINGEFNPFVSILDLIANTGKDGVKYMNSLTMNYNLFLQTEAAKKYLENK